MNRTHGKSALLVALVATFALVGAIALAGCANSNATATSNTLKVGVLTDVAGMSEYNKENDRYYGMEVDLAEEMANRMGYAGAEFVGVTTDTAIDMLSSGEVDALASCLSVTEQRKKSFDFSDAYYTDHLVVMVENSSLIASIEDLKGGTVGALAGANSSKDLRQQLKQLDSFSGKLVSSNDDKTDVQYKSWRLLEFDTLSELSDALEAGTIDALATDGAIAAKYLTSERSLVKDFSGEEQDYAVATQKDSELSPKVAQAIKDMIDDGTVESLTEKWS